MSQLQSRIAEAVKAIRKVTKQKPDVAVILGTGLGGFSAKLTKKVSIAYEDIPHFPTSTVTSHAGKFVIGKLGKKTVVAMEGRFHFYEGYTMEQVTFPVRVMHALGAGTLMITNASGGLNPLHSPGDILIIEDHINLPGLAGIGPLVGPNDDKLGPRFPDLFEVYSHELVDLAKDVAMKQKISVQVGTYVMVAGPNLETRAEYRMLRTMGADAVGMSSVPEALVAVHGGMKVMGLSCITDLCSPESLKPVDIDEIIATASGAEPKLTAILAGVIKGL